MSNSIKLPHDHGNKISEHFTVHSPDVNTITQVADTMKQLGDPSRLRIFWILCHTEECVTDIAALVDMSSPAVSHHLRILKSAGLITSRRDKKEMLYKASDTEMAKALHIAIETMAHIACPQIK